jgi:hypothetical protein
MIIREYISKIKGKEREVIILIMGLIALHMYLFTYITEHIIPAQPIYIMFGEDYSAIFNNDVQDKTVKNTSEDQGTVSNGLYVASKNGTKYYYSWCSGVSRISEKNKIWFETEKMAQERGLEPAANCIK